MDPKKGKASVFDSAINEADLAKFREELTTYKHNLADTDFLSATLTAKVGPIARLPAILRTLSFEACKRLEVPEGQAAASSLEAMRNAVPRIQ